MDGGCVGCSWRKSFHSHYVAEIPLSLRSKGVFYYSIPVQDFLHEHPGVRQQFASAARLGLSVGLETTGVQS